MNFDNALGVGLDGERRTGRFDLCLYPQADVPDEAPLKGIVEIKRLNNPLAFDYDAARIRDIKRNFPYRLCGVVCGSLFTKSPISDITIYKSQIARQLTIGQAGILDHGFTTPDRSGYFYGGLGCIV